MQIAGEDVPVAKVEEGGAGDTLLGTVVRFAPLLAGLSFCASLFYAYAYFGFLGREWMSFLSAQDLFALTWMAAPGLVIGLVVGMANGKLAPPSKNRTELKSFSELMESAKEKPAYLQIATILYVLFVGLFPVIGVYFLLSAGDILDPASAFRYIVIVWVLLLLSILRFILFYVSHTPVRRVDIIFLVATMAVSVYCSGLIEGAMAVSDYSYTIKAKGWTFACAAKLYGGERGVLFKTPDQAVGFAPLKEISSITRLPHPCWTAHKR